MNGTAIPRVQRHVHLGITVTSDLRWNDHVATVLKKVAPALHLSLTLAYRPSATSSSYSEILRCIYTTAHGVLQCCVVWRISRVSEVTGKGAAESRKSHCSLATWATGT